VDLGVEPVSDPGVTLAGGTVKGSEVSVSGKSIPIEIYLPDGGGPFPMVLFLHGFQLSAKDYASYGKHLASWGYVVVAPTMPSGLLGIGGPTHVELKQYLAGLLDWAQQDATAGTSVLEHKANVESVGLAGHSMGGKISLLLATEDPRVDAVFGIDPVDSSGPIPMSPQSYPSVTPELMPKIKAPLALLGETLNGTCSGFLCQPCAPEADNFHQYYLYAQSPAIEIEVKGANHMSFLDNPNCGLACSVCQAGTDDPATTRMLTRRYMTAFFNVLLKGQTGYDQFLSGDGMQADEAAGLVASQVKNGF
jgi:chlorophyllase